MCCSALWTLMEVKDTAKNSLALTLVMVKNVRSESGNSITYVRRLVCMIVPNALQFFWNPKPDLSTFANKCKGICSAFYWEPMGFLVGLWDASTCDTPWDLFVFLTSFPDSHPHLLFDKVIDFPWFSLICLSIPRYHETLELFFRKLLAVSFEVPDY